MIPLGAGGAHHAVAQVSSADSVCVQGTCLHPRAVKMVQCSRCNRWMHCICAHVPIAKARTSDYVFICYLCGSHAQ